MFECVQRSRDETCIKTSTLSTEKKIKRKSEKTSRGKKNHGSSRDYVECYEKNNALVEIFFRRNPCMVQSFFL